jgi:cytochrome c oxidase subunit 2
VLGTILSGCSGPQSALDPAGEESDQVATLFWMMTGGGFFIWVCVLVLLLHASRRNRAVISGKSAATIPFWAGVVFPVIFLTALLSYALWLMPSLRPFAPGQQPSLRIEVEGNQFWWRVTYHRFAGGTVVSANEIRIPVGERVEFSLRSADMIHSFWIPALGGKMDLIPGRVNRLSLRATRTGRFRGQCAEFCGTGHAMMALPVVVMEADQFDGWLDARAKPSTGLGAELGARDLFLQHGCGGCHRIEGTDAQGRSGPDLSHIGSRLTIGAGLLDNDTENLARFIVNSGLHKPGSKMPAYPGLTDAELNSIVAWLKGLQ